MSMKKSLPFKFFVYIWELKSVNVTKSGNYYTADVGFSKMLICINSVKESIHTLIVSPM